MKNLLWCLAITTGLSAQAPDHVSLQRDLLSANAKTVAAATRAFRSSPDKRLAGVLNEALGYWRQQSGKHASVVRLCLLDALLATDVRLPADHLLPFVKDQWASGAALSLLARDHTSSQDQLLRIFTELKDPAVSHGNISMRGEALTRLAIGNMLAEDKVPGFCRHLLKTLDLQLHVTVAAPRQTTFTYSISRGPTPPAVASLGPTPIHRLSRGAPALFCATGTKHAISITSEHLTYERHKPFSSGTHRWIAADDADGMHWLAMMSEQPESCPPRRLALKIGTTDISKQRVRCAQQKLQAFVDRLLADLVKHKCLTSQQAEALPHTVTVAVLDLRADTSTPLPYFNAKSKKSSPR